MNREINKKQVKMASNKGEYVTKTELFQELKEIKKDVKEVKKILNNNKEKSVTQLYKVEARKEDAKITKLEVQEDKLIAQLSDSRELSIPISWFAK
jgi:protein subunit release factor A